MNNQNLMPPWKPGQSGNPKGRPKNRVPKQLAVLFSQKTAKKMDGLTELEIKTWDVQMLSMDASQLKTLIQWDKAPAYVKANAIAILFDMRNGKTTTVDKLREKIFGKDTQRMELTGAGGKDLIPARVLTKAEAADLLQSLDKDY